MRGLRAVYALALSDYLERTRRSSFLIVLGLAVVASYFYLPANSSTTKTLVFTIDFGGYRGIYNSAWVGTQVALFATTWLVIIGFYLVKNTVERDTQTKVGQIIAATPMHKTEYTLGKALSNFAVLVTMVIVLAISAGVMQIVRGEDTHIDVWALLSPFVFIMLPAMALVAALAILVETVALLRGTVGNVGYFFFIAGFFTLAESVNLGSIGDLLGLNFVVQQIQQGLKAAVPGYNGNFNYGTRFGTAFFHTFRWEGAQWNSDILLSRLFWVGLALAIALFAALLFARFDTSKEKQRRARSASRKSALMADREASVPVLAPIHLTALPARKEAWRGMAILAGELRLQLKGVVWWWYIGAAALIVLCFLLPFSVALAFLFPLAWLWALPLWSALGNREARHHTTQLVFSTAHPLARQLSMQWLAGVVIALLTASGMIAHFVVMGDWSGVLATGVGAIFVPALALASGVWTGTSRLFEIVFVVLWYIGTINHVAALDFMSVSAAAPGMRIPIVYTLAALVLLALAFVGRRQQLQV